MEFLRGDEDRYQGTVVLYTKFPSPRLPDILAAFATRDLGVYVDFLTEDAIKPSVISRFLERVKAKDEKMLAKDSGHAIHLIVKLRP